MNQRAGKDKTDDLIFSKAENKKWRAAVLEDAGIENYRWHDKRHIFRSRLVQVGVHLKIAQVVDAMEVLNWVSWTTDFI